MGQKKPEEACQDTQRDAKVVALRVEVSKTLRRSSASTKLLQGLVRSTTITGGQGLPYASFKKDGPTPSPGKPRRGRFDLLAESLSKQDNKAT